MRERRHRMKMNHKLKTLCEITYIVPRVISTPFEVNARISLNFPLQRPTLFGDRNFELKLMMSNCKVMGN